jgi:signal transduction histidine kinase
MTKAGVIEAVLNTSLTNHYIDSRVRIRGVFWRMPGPVLLLPSESCVLALEAAPKDVFNVPLLPIAAVLSNQVSPATDRRLKICGEVTCWRDDFLMVQDETGGIRLDVAGQTNISVGDKIEVVGFPNHNPTGKRLSAVILRRFSEGTMTRPVSEDVFQLRNRGRLVSLKAILVTQHAGDTMQTLDVQAGQRMFRALLPVSKEKLGKVAVGSQLRLTGVMLVDGGDTVLASAPGKGTGMVGSVEILLRRPQDVSVLKSPPWWNWKFTVAAISLFAVVLAFSLIWIRMLRRRVAQRTNELRETMIKLKKETEISATLAERDRLAGEIHDSLEQGLSAIMMQMEAASKLVNQPDEVEQYLIMARNMASFSRTEVQHAVWDLQSPMLENADLGTALHRVAREINAGDMTQVTVQISGNVRPLPPSVEHHLLRIGQEAITNAVKHGHPKTISLTLDYGASDLTLTVCDDGRGFDPQAVAADDGHFGLKGIRVRARKINAALTISSKPKEGTSIKIVMPMENPSAKH